MGHAVGVVVAKVLGQMVRVRREIVKVVLLMDKVEVQGV